MSVPGIGSAAPQTLLEIICDTFNEWIRMHTGIQGRRVLVHDGTWHAEGYPSFFY